MAFWTKQTGACGHEWVIWDACPYCSQKLPGMERYKRELQNFERHKGEFEEVLNVPEDRR